MKVTSTVHAKAQIAQIVLETSAVESRLGMVELRQHQSEGVARILKSIRKFRGALLCDEVGLGKTFTAAAVMRSAESAVVIAPAGLVQMWNQALATSHLSAPVLSLEQFSQTVGRSCARGLVVVDEAHHLRNRRTRRFRNVAAFVANADVLLLSATPLHNRREDVVSLISLFLGSRAAELSPDDFATCVIRRRASAGGDVPQRIHITDESPAPSDIVRRMVMALPPPVPPSDGSECASLVQFTLLRQWASSDAALRHGLRSRIARAQVLAASLEAGRLPTRKEISSWIAGDLDVQLGFAELLASPGGDESLLRAVRQHEQATAELLAVVDSHGDWDLWRADYLRALRAKYADRKIVTFTQFASTARALYHLIRCDGRVGLVTAQRCEIASGLVSRQDIINRFAPRGAGCKEPPVRETITLLITTDLCSEGLNLQDAGVVVHMDAPWTPARVEQRIGRIARTGSQHKTVFVHSLNTPPIADDLLRIESRLRRKSLLTEEVVGATDESASHSPASVADASEQLISLLKSWKARTVRGEGGQPIAAVTGACSECFLALISDDMETCLACDIGQGITTDPRDLLKAAQLLTDEDLHPDSLRLSIISGGLHRWAQQRSLAANLNLSASASAVRRRLAKRVSRAAQAISTHHRAAAATSMDAARASLSAVHSAGVEMRMFDLCERTQVDTALLQQVAEVGRDRGKTKAEPVERSGFHILVLLVGSPR